MKKRRMTPGSRVMMVAFFIILMINVSSFIATAFMVNVMAMLVVAGANILAMFGIPVLIGRVRAALVDEAERSRWE